jgi:hypothetical protein
MQPITKHNLFSLGQVVATPGALTALQKAGQQPQEFLARHLQGDWGDLCEEDRQENALSLERGFRLLSRYNTSAGEALYVITEADRSVTTLLLPEEYETRTQRRPNYGPKWTPITDRRISGAGRAHARRNLRGRPDWRGKRPRTLRRRLRSRTGRRLPARLPLDSAGGRTDLNP